MKKAMLYIHGKGGSAAEAARYREICPGYDVVGLPYQHSTPWETREEIRAAYAALARDHDSVSLLANSIGAYFAMNALGDVPIERAFFISPIVDMERLIGDMMRWAGVTEAALQERGEISTDFGETLSWAYLCWVRDHPIGWNIPTAVLYGGRDNLTARETIEAFCRQPGRTLRVLEEGEHWFHTEDQLRFLDQWLRENLQ